MSPISSVISLDINTSLPESSATTAWKMKTFFFIIDYSVIITVSFVGVENKVGIERCSKAFEFGALFHIFK